LTKIQACLLLLITAGFTFVSPAFADDQPPQKHSKAAATPVKTPAADAVVFGQPATPSPTPMAGRTSVELSAAYADSIRSIGFAGRDTAGWQSELRLDYAVADGLSLGLGLNGLGLVDQGDSATVAGLVLNLRWLPFVDQGGPRPYVELNGGGVLAHGATGAAPSPGASYQGGGAVGMLWPLGTLPLALDSFVAGQYIGPHGQALHAVSAGLGLSYRFGPSPAATPGPEIGLKSLGDEKLAVVGGGWKGSIQFRGNGDATPIKDWSLELRDGQDNLLKTLHGTGPLPDAVDLRDVRPQAKALRYKMTVNTEAGLMYDRSGEIGKAIADSPGGGTADGGGGKAQVMVKDGDSLWMISADRQVYGDPLLYYLIIDANKQALKDPDKLKPGQTLKIEHDVTKRARAEALKRAWARKEQQEAQKVSATAVSGEQ